MKSISLLLAALATALAGAQGPVAPPAPVDPNSVAPGQLLVEQQLHRAEDLDFRLRPGSPAVDEGTPLPNVTDGSSGRTPDLGALELGAIPPHYGPRP